MKILGINISKAKRDLANAELQTKSISPGAAAWLQGKDLDGLVLTNTYQQVVWVYRAINALAEQVANIPFLFSAGERGKENLITSGPLHDFYARPHPQINRFQYWELRVMWLMLRGECFRVPIYSTQPDADRNLNLNPNLNLNLNPDPSPKGHSSLQTKRLRTVLIPDPAHFHHIIENHELVGWRYTGFGPQAPLASQVFLPEEVWFEKLPNPFDFWRGMSPLYVASVAASTEFAAGAFMKGLIENNADLGLIVRTKDPLGAEQREEVLAELDKRKRRAGRADGPLVLWSGMEVVKPEVSSSDLQFLENRKFSRAEICAAFGVPEEIVTTTDHSKYDVMAGARLNFIENRVAPLCSRLEAGEEVTVKSLDPQATGWFDLESLPIMQTARQSRLAAAKTGFDMGVPFNELNRVLDLGFQPLPWGNRGYLSTKLQEVGREDGQNRTAMQSLGSSLEGPGGKKIEEALAVAHVSASEPLQRMLDVLRELEEGQPPAFSASVKLKRNKLSRFFFEQRGRVLGKLQGLIGPIGPICLIFRLPEETRSLAELLEPLLVQDLQSGALQLCQEHGQAALDLPQAAITEYLLSRHSQWSTLNQITLRDLEQTFEQGIALGEGAESLAARVRTVFNHAAAARAQEIAVAETLAAREAATKLTTTRKD